MNTKEKPAWTEKDRVEGVPAVKDCSPSRSNHHKQWYTERPSLTHIITVT